MRFPLPGPWGRGSPRLQEGEGHIARLPSEGAPVTEVEEDRMRAPVSQPDTTTSIVGLQFTCLRLVLLRSPRYFRSCRDLVFELTNSRDQQET